MDGSGRSFKGEDPMETEKGTEIDHCGMLRDDRVPKPDAHF